MNKTLWVVDPIPYLGGSKVASEALLKEIETTGYQIKVFSRDVDFWLNSGFDCYALFNVKALEDKVSGYPYFFKHIIITVQVFLRLLFSRNGGKLMGISGPGVDMSVYWLSRIFSLDVIQVVHGSVAPSKTNIKNLLKAKVVACLESEFESIKNIFIKNDKNPEGIVFSFINGIHCSRWPTATDSDFLDPHFFWAASLLKWKRIELFLDSLLLLTSKRSQATVCYIKPKSTCLQVSNEPLKTPSLAVYEQPKNLDELRAKANIFVSTSLNEPFGLSILEALAAGLCVVIPADGAYWDQVLSDRENCVKYNPGQEYSLTHVFKWMEQNMGVVESIAEHGMELANDYRSSVQYANIVQAILN